MDAVLLRVDDVAARLNESAWSVRQRIRRGEIAAIRTGRGRRGAYRVEESALAAFLDARRTSARTAS